MMSFREITKFGSNEHSELRSDARYNFVNFSS